MTTAPANLLAVRRLLLDHLNIDVDTVRGDDLEPAEVGIVGDPDHRGGYHCGSDRVVANDYSVVESTRDSSGLTLYASALDVGLFAVQAGGRTHNLFTFSNWCVAQCVANTADSRDLREIIYSPDGQTVRRWDRLGKRTTGDGSHLYHTHFSFFRDSTKAGRDQTPLFRRYLTTIGLLEDDDMDATERAALMEVRDNLRRICSGSLETATGTVLAPSVWRVRDEKEFQPTVTGGLSRIEATLNTLASKDMTDEQAIIAGVLAGLTPEKIAAAIPPTIAKQVADELARRMVA